MYFFSTVMTFLYLQWVKMGCAQLWFLDLGSYPSCPVLGGAKPNQLQCHWEQGQCPAKHTQLCNSYVLTLFYILKWFLYWLNLFRLKNVEKVLLTAKNLLKSWAMLENAARWLSSCGRQQHSSRSLLSHTLTAKERAVEKNWELLLLSMSRTPSGSMGGGWGRESPSGSNTNSTPKAVNSRIIQLAWEEKWKMLNHYYLLDNKTMTLGTQPTWQPLLKWQHLWWQDCSHGCRQIPIELPDRPTPIQGCKGQLAGTLRQGWSGADLGLWWYLKKTYWSKDHIWPLCGSSEG